MPEKLELESKSFIYSLICKIVAVVIIGRLDSNIEWKTSNNNLIDSWVETTKLVTP